MDLLRSIGQFVLPRLHWALILFGVALMTAANLLPFFNHPPWPIIVKVIDGIAAAMLSGGVFSALVKSMLFTQIFRERVQEVMRSADFLESLHSLSDSWRDLAAGIYRTRLPDLAIHLRGALADRVPDNKEWFYKTYRLVMAVDWADETKTRLRIRRRLNILVQKQSAATPFPYSTTVSAAAGAATPLDMTVEYLRIDGRSFDLQNELDIVRAPSGDRIDLRLKQPMTGRLQHHVERQTVSFLTLSDDPTFFFEAQNYTAQVEVEVHLKADDIGAIFFEIGTTEPYFPYTPAPDERDTHAFGRTTERLPFPGQGFMLIFTKQTGDQDAAR